jgi:hypothetical protein
MRIAAWVITVVLLVAGVVILVEALTTTYGVWVSIPLLLLSGVFTGPGVITYRSIGSPFVCVLGSFRFLARMVGSCAVTHAG